MGVIWNPWHGCQKISSGCQNCYVYRKDAEFGKNSRIVNKTQDFYLPLKKDRRGNYKWRDNKNPIYTCLTSDFFLEDADGWRKEVWQIIKERRDLQFYIITKRIHRFEVELPEDWNEGYENVTIGCTCENQNRADYRIPIFLDLPIRHREVIQEPMLESINIENYLSSGKIEKVICGGESGVEARLCDYDWILYTREQCVRQKVGFFFKQTGANFKKGERLFRISRRNQMEQAVKAGINFDPT